MSRERRSMLERMVETGTRLAAEAAGQVMKDPRGQEAVARAVGIAQRGVKRLEELQTRVMKVAGVPGRTEYQELARQLARIKRKARELSEQLDASARDAAEEDAEGGSGAAKAGPRGDGRTR